MGLLTASKKTKKNLKSGYSLVEVLVSLGLIGMLLVLLFNSLTTSVMVAIRNNGRNAVREELDFITAQITRDIRNADLVTACGDTSSPNSCEFVSLAKKYRWEMCETKVCKNQIDTTTTNIYTSSTNLAINVFDFVKGYSDNTQSRANVILTIVGSHTRENLNVKNVVKQVSFSTRNYELSFINSTPVAAKTFPKAGGTARYDYAWGVANSRFYAWGGSTSAGLLNTMDIYDLTTGNWTTGPNGYKAKASTANVMYNNKLYIWGGTDGSSLDNCITIFDTSTSLWSTGACGGTATRGATAEVYNGMIYIFGGRNCIGSCSGDLRQLVIYKPATNSFILGKEGQFPVYGHSVSVSGNKMYIFGGWNGGTAEVGYLQICTFSPWGTYYECDWNYGPASTQKKVYHSSTIVGDYMYVFGGADSVTGVLSSLQKYQLSTATWSNATSAPEKRESAGVFVYNNKMYIWGGYNGSTMVNTFLVYDLATQTWL